MFDDPEMKDWSRSGSLASSATLKATHEDDNDLNELESQPGRIECW